MLGQVSGFLYRVTAAIPVLNPPRKRLVRVWTHVSYQGELLLLFLSAEPFVEIHLFSQMDSDKFSVICFVEKLIYVEAYI